MVQGQIQAPGGGNVGGISVTLTDANGNVYTTTTDQYGYYSFGDPNDPADWYVVPGQDTVTVNAPGWVFMGPNPRTVEVDPATDAWASFDGWHSS